MQCPKCRAPMHTYNRNGVQIEQCSGCRGIFLDYGELESLTRLEAQWSQPAPPAAPPAAPQAYPAAPQAPAWGAPHGAHYGHRRHKSFGHMLFSS
ncbi:zf-TFIIB domain-containing protein [Streptomyces sp. NPDC052012]|uniref:TFIIB-type zinc ribbon-containing protein n=1 Tax=Streptomyces sp. NPDC052012 TaxID=3155051 RepID=UPI00344DC7B0